MIQEETGMNPGKVTLKAGDCFKQSWEGNPYPMHFKVLAIDREGNRLRVACYSHDGHGWEETWDDLDVTENAFLTGEYRMLGRRPAGVNPGGLDAPISDDLEKVANEYAWAHDTIGVNRDTFSTRNVPVEKMVRVPIAEEIKTAVLFGANWQRRLDADLGSPAYQRGFCDGREYEKAKNAIHRAERASEN